MNEPAFARPNFFLPNGDIGCVSQQGISQRRLLAGMILSGWLAGMHANDSEEGWTIKAAVAESIEYADELIKQTEA